jgi:6-phosphogluconolactonase/glucosamine-6-phosphate isomerase/deaminase
MPAVSRSQTGEAAATWHVLPNTGQLEEVVANRVLALAGQAIADHGRFRIVLAGGHTPAAV